MYNEYFGLKEAPFSIAPDPRYLYMSEQHREALAHLIYGFNSDGGFVLLTGEVGTGKTTVCRCLLEQAPENSDIAFIFNPKLSVEELLATICDEFGIRYPKNNSSIKVFTDLINNYLLDSHSRGRRAILIIDEAQNLSSEVLEQLRLLTNLETNQFKLLQIILLGQPELRDKLSKPELRQLSQRIIAKYHLGTLSKNDIGAYISHRLSVAGIQKQLFLKATINKIYNLTNGIPRLINVICDRALLGAYTKGENTVDRSVLIKAAREIYGESSYDKPARSSSAAVWTICIILFLAAGIIMAAGYIRKTLPPAATTVAENKLPAAAAEPQLDKIQLHPGFQPDKSIDAAFKDLFNQWKIKYVPDRNVHVCNYAEQHGLWCLEGPGNLDIIRNTNRPAVLTLHDDSGNNFFAALTAINMDTATIRIGNETLTVSTSDINSHWLGEYTLFWRPPSKYRRKMLPGDKGPLIQWLEKKMSLVNNRPPRSSKDITFDNNLVMEVKKFQVAEGLVPDGVVGFRTLIHLNTVTGNNVPVLIQEEKDI
jgi:general secretion pathway protein A